MSPDRQPPATAVFYSTIRHWGWGAPDYVWPVAAEELLHRGVKVAAFVRSQLLTDERIARLSAAGAQVFPQPPLHYARGRIARARTWLARHSEGTRRLQRVLRDSVRPHVFIDQGGTYDFLDESQLLDCLAESQATYDIFFHSNNRCPPLPVTERTRAANFVTRAKRCLFNSRWMRDLSELQLLVKLPSARFFPLPVRFDHDEPLPWPGDATVRLATVSRLDMYHKGLDALFEALALLPRTVRPWTLDVFGQGPDEEYLRSLASWLGLQDRVRFHGRIEDVRAVWPRRHLLVLTSRYEGLSVAMLEAMACGRPVLRTPYGGCTEWVSHGETGYVCPAAEPALIAASLRDAIADFDRWPSVGRAAHARIRSQLPSHPESVYLEPFRSADSPT